MNMLNKKELGYLERSTEKLFISKVVYSLVGYSKILKEIYPVSLVNRLGYEPCIVDVVEIDDHQVQFIIQFKWYN